MWKHKVSVDPIFQTYFQSFKDSAASQGVDLKLNDINLSISILPNLTDPNTGDNSAMGICYMGDDPGGVVQISQEYWNQVDNSGKQELLFHELGHCILHRQHRQDLDPSQIKSIQTGSGTEVNGLALSVMYPYFLPTDQYLTNYTQYIFELFHSTDLSSALPIKADNSGYYQTNKRTLSRSRSSGSEPAVVLNGKVWHCPDPG